jgi:hypothetical protein
LIDDLEFEGKKLSSDNSGIEEEGDVILVKKGKKENPRKAVKTQCVMNQRVNDDRANDLCRGGQGDGHQQDEVVNTSNTFSMESGMHNFSLANNQFHSRMAMATMEPDPEAFQSLPGTAEANLVTGSEIIEEAMREK